MGTGGEILARNIEALSAWNPPAAALLSCAVIPAGWQRAAGSDGTPTFHRVIADAPRRVEWLGGTSLPAASAPSLTADMDTGTGTAMGLGIGAGYEWLALAARLASHQAVFVLESDITLCRMALEICDLSSLLAAGKIIPLLGDTAESQLFAFLQTNLGFDVPTVMHQLPSVPPARRDALRIAAEAMIRRAIVQRTAAGNELLAQLAAYTPVPGRIIGFTAARAHAGERVLTDALRAVGPGVVELAADHHASTSLVARLSAIATHCPASAWSDFYRGQLGLPAEFSALAVHTWVPPAAGFGYFSPDRLPRLDGPDRVIVHSTEHRDVLAAFGVPRERIDLVPLAVCVDALPQNPAAIRSGIGLVADVPSLDPAAYGFDLPSHVSVWDAARKLIMDDPFEAFAHRSADLFRRAQRSANVTIDDPAVADPMERAIRHALLRAAVWITTARLLIDAGLPVRLIGRGWENHDLKATIAPFGPPAAMFAGLAALVHIHPAAVVDPLLLAAAASGIAIIAVDHPKNADPGGLATLLEPARDFAPPRGKDLIPTAKRILADAAARDTLAAAAGKHIRAAHTWDKRKL